MLTYIGPSLSTGEPERSLNYHGLPAGDLDEATLTEEQVALALQSGLYERRTAGDEPPKSPNPARRPRRARAPESSNDEPATGTDGGITAEITEA